MRGEYFMNSEAGGISITARREKIYSTQKRNTYKPGLCMSQCEIYTVILPTT